MADHPYTQDRELSWLAFNDRVLSEAMDETVPLLERLKFAAIFTSNLDEFFMIRVGSLFDLENLKPDTHDVRSGMTPKEQLEAIYKASQEAINVIKLRIRMVDAQITRILNSGDVTQGGYL